MTMLQQQARALGDPTRYRIFRCVADAGAPVGVAALTDLVGLNHNAVRQHLAKLVDAQLLVEGTAPPTGRGRPRLQYTLDPSAESQWGVAGPYERLSLWLSEILRTGSTPVEVGRRVGRRRRLGQASRSDEAEAVPPPADAAAGDGDGVDVFESLVDQMARHGFDPVVERSPGGEHADIVLHNCPFSSVALADPDSVCGIHLGIAYGIAESLDGLVVDGLEPHDPRRAGCRLRCHVDPAAST
ncbi:MAG TPA: helix-turn-helix domain-containing protein [Acidimicrobiales bacterium]|nr:helix-turn-helix domain-containing protein [Acidimicrobiales bacterium]